MHLWIKQMHIHVEIGHTGKTIPQEVSSDTIDYVKGKIRDKNGIPLDVQGYETVGNRDILPGSSFHLDIH
ncbi:polyubiquitin 3 [Tanacetum coccineum]|uniref:Polyubiquitin 3 n=1 Tax=Tanacetum coccineum TaxID=301880 RepID=A0ABQ5FLP6_9ASTR